MPQPTSHAYPSRRRKVHRLGLNRKQASKLLGISPDVLRKRVNAGEIKLFHDGSVDPDQFNPEKEGLDAELQSAMPPGVSLPSPPARSAGKRKANGGDDDDEVKRWFWENQLAESKAKISWVRYYKEAGDLVEKSLAEAQYYSIIRSARDRLMSLPDRIAPIVAAQSDVRQCRTLIAKEIRDALDLLSTELDLQAEEPLVNEANEG